MITVTISNDKIQTEPHTTPLQILNSHFPTLKEILICKRNGKFVDLSSPITTCCRLEFCKFEDCKEIFWHSSAHVLGNALQNIYPGCKLVNGPPIDNGFFYDVDIETPISSLDFSKVENEMKKIFKMNQKFNKQEFSKEELLDLYKNNEYKTHFINTKVGESSTVYSNGDFIDLCQGPHILSTGQIKAVKLLKVSSAYFQNNPANKQLQRVYAITFPTKDLLAEYIKKQEEALQKDHRRIGTSLELFFFHEYSPGSAFFLPNGTHVYNKLLEFLRLEYKKRGFNEVITPNVFFLKLWKESGHWDNYKENMFILDDMALKPMNCPSHCLMFKNTYRTYRELPLRLADFGALHRNEASGALTGLTRVRRFQQDDAHIFCEKSQIKNEIKSCLEFIKDVYKIFNFKFELFLSTRPEKYIGELEEWEKAENDLEEGIKESGFDYKINEGDGAFYGPKIDILLQDALGRKAQCATIQLDFQLPIRFNLKYRSSDGNTKVPVIIHRAILGSIERFMAILLENYGMRLPFWLTPRQIGIICLTENKKYIEEIKNCLFDYKTKIIDDNNTLGKNIRILLKEEYNLICVVGNREAESGEINLRWKNKQIVYKLDDFLRMINRMNEEKKEYEEISQEMEVKKGLEKIDL